MFVLGDLKERENVGEGPGKRDWEREREEEEKYVVIWSA